MRVSVFAFTLLAGFATAPALAVDHDSQLWLKAAAKFDLGSDFDLLLETNQRFSSDRDGLYESQYLLGLAYEIADGITLTGGVNRVVGLRDGRVSSTEWRPRQQIAFPIAKLGPGDLGGRHRLEQRFRDNVDETGHRLRPQIAYEFPLSEKVDIELAHESYFNLNSTPFQDSGHERMRNSLSLSFPLAESLKGSLGYLNQYRFNQGEPDLMEHALTLGISFSL